MDPESADIDVCFVPRNDKNTICRSYHVVARDTLINIIILNNSILENIN